MNLIEQNREKILEVARHHGATSVRLFGSFARGDAKDSSDVDLLVETGPNTTPWFPGGLIADLEILLGRRIDVVTEKSLHPKLRDRVLKEARLL